MGTTIFITSASIGDDGELGRLLMKNFLYSLARADVAPTRVLLMNEGVRLACSGSDSVDDLQALVDADVIVRACGTCLDYLGLKDALVVGEVGTMPGAVDALMADGRVVTIR